MEACECGSSQIGVHVNDQGSIGLIVRSYERLIRDLKDVVKYSRSDMNDHAIAASKHAQDLITELLLGLDYSQGGEISSNLSKIYSFALRSMIEHSEIQSTDIYSHLIVMFTSLKEAWSSIAIQN